jgi:hypothetical protein
MLGSNQRPPPCRDGTGWVGGGRLGWPTALFLLQNGPILSTRLPSAPLRFPIVVYVICTLSARGPDVRTSPAIRLPLPGGQPSGPTARPGCCGSYDRQRFEWVGIPSEKARPQGALDPGPARRTIRPFRRQLAAAPWREEGAGRSPSGLIPVEWRNRKVANAIARSSSSTRGKRSWPGRSSSG